MTHEHGASAVSLDTLRMALERQYRAGLAMLRDAVERCPESLWDDPTPTNAFWQIAYHTLYFTHLYLQPEEAAFRPWSGHQAEVENRDGIAGADEPAGQLLVVPEPYTREQVLAYVAHLEAGLRDAVEALDLLAPDCGFWWYRPMAKLEHQLVNLRHLQHHAGQLADRVRNHAGVGVDWVSSRAADAAG
jgi:hypothetical protein